MTFEVINNDGKTVMHTEHISCIPTNEQLASMYNSGYKFKFNGKPANLKKVKDNKSDTSIL